MTPTPVGRLGGGTGAGAGRVSGGSVAGQGRVRGASVAGQGRVGGGLSPARRAGRPVRPATGGPTTCGFAPGSGRQEIGSATGPIGRCQSGLVPATDLECGVRHYLEMRPG
jgi:hypothetical protein